MSGKRGFHLLLVMLLFLVGAERVLADELAFAPAPLGPDLDRPIILTSTEMTSWVEGNLEIVLLRDGAVIEQGLLRIRGKEAVAWIGPRSSQPNQPVPVMVFVSGEVAVERDGKQQKLPKGLFELQTRTELRLKSHRRETGTGVADPFYRQALAERQLLLQPREPNRRHNDPEGPPIQTVAAPAGHESPKGKGASKTRTVEVMPTQLQAPGPPPAPGAASAPPGARPRRIQIAPMGAAGYQSDSFQQGEEQVTVILSPVTVFVEDVDGLGLVDISTDRAVIWTRKGLGDRFLGDAAEGEPAKEHVEIYLEGNVAIRKSEVRGPQAYVTQILLASSAYYDVSRNLALLTNGEIVTTQAHFPETIHLRGAEIRQVAQNRFEATDVSLFASRLPSDPDLVFKASHATFEQRMAPATGLFGRPARDAITGEPLMVEQLWTTADDVTVNARGVPFFYWPRLEGDLRDPFGPLQAVRFRTDRIFGTGLMVDWDVFKLFGATRPPDTQWLLETDYLSRRGPMLGTDFRSRGMDLFGLPGPYQTMVRARGVYDQASTDILGGNRDYPIDDPWRGRFLGVHRQEVGLEWTFLGQLALLTDRNFYEQYFKREFDNDPNQETFVWLKYQVDNWAGTIEARPHLREWVTEGAWLPKVSGYWLGKSLFDKFTYSIRGSVGYAQFRPSSDIPSSYPFTFVPDEFVNVRPLPPSTDMPHSGDLDLGRLDVWQELALPLEVGPFKFVPYGLLDTAFYTQTLDSENEFRLYGGGGARLSIPFTKVDLNKCSTLFNVNGLAHKVTFEADYRYVQTNVGFRTLPELDRINDDATDQALRDIRAYRLMNYPSSSKQFFVGSSPYFDPQLYAIRSGMTSNADTLDDLQVIRLGIDQRFQTKRGFPGLEHVIDWITIDLTASLFPEKDRDNFGQLLGLLQYDAAWHIGDRTTLVSEGWYDPGEWRARVFTIGLYVNRPDRLQYYLGFRSMEPVGSQAIVASTRYRLSQKYSIRFTNSYDFGEKQSLGNSFVFTRTGSDLEMSLGFSYDALTENFGVVFDIVPTLASSGRGWGRGSSMLSGGILGR